ncbi:SDR family oxidoreductase [Actinopolymorpha sp. B9G3]|uniref:SDR family oxidoreductase n=1 Tax=Actinopolymorpha sp. B9G3 TaxID=3158970 RepID=UPI0032D95742
MTWTVRDKTVLVTGATSGIGLETSVELARHGARVVLVGRDPERTQAAVETVRARAGVEPVHLLCDFSRQASIRALAKAYADRFDRLDVLVDNAGAVNLRRRLTEDGIETTFAVNHLGYFLLTNLLLDLIVASTPARVVVVASINHRSGTLDFDDLGFARGYSAMKAYGRSKLANVLFATELARRLAGTGVTVNSVHPGAIDTNIWSAAPALLRPVIRLFMRREFISIEEGSGTVVQLAESPDLEGVTGCYFERRTAVPPAPLAQDPVVAARLWDVSAELVGLG